MVMVITINYSFSISFLHFLIYFLISSFLISHFLISHSLFYHHPDAACAC